MMLQSLLGIAVFLGLAWIISEDRKSFPVRIVLTGLSLQFLLAAVLLNFAPFKELFIALNSALLSLEAATKAGTAFVFGYLGGGALPFDENTPGSSFILAFRALPLVLVVSALSALLFYWRILPFIVSLFAKLLEKSMGIGGALGLGSAANIFVGMIEAPLFIKPYLQQMNRGELFTLMVCGMATIAGTMMVLYASIIGQVLPDAMGHIISASIISVPAAILLAAILIPPSETTTANIYELPDTADNAIDALTKGTLQGVQLLLNIIAMLIVFVALVTLTNLLLALLPDYNNQPITLEMILGFIMAPIVWLMGIPWQEAMTAGSLMGIKTVLNEFLAYIQLASLSDDQLSPSSKLIMVYALCGFANFGSLGIMLGGLGTMVPERREEITRLGLKSIYVGTLATLMTGAIVNIVV